MHKVCEPSTRAHLGTAAHFWTSPTPKPKLEPGIKLITYSVLSKWFYEVNSPTKSSNLLFTITHQNKFTVLQGI